MQDAKKEKGNAKIKTLRQSMIYMLSPSHFVKATIESIVKPLLQYKQNRSQYRREYSLLN
jgi:hypothetical protein